jgi:plastocyanin
MPKTLSRTVATTSLACVVTFSACQPQQPQGAESSSLTELNGESVTENTATSEVVSATENSAPAAPETTTPTEAPTAASSTAVETTSSVAETSSTVASTTSAAPQTTSTTATTATTTSTIATATTEATTTTIAESTTTSSPAVVTTTTTAPESTTTTAPVVASTTTSVPMSSSYYSIDISGFSFAPSALTVQVGDTVTWTNLDSAGHTVTFSGSPTLSSGGLQEGDTHSVTFDSVGTYAYGCSPHASMQGTITVTK